MCIPGVNVSNVSENRSIKSSAYALRCTERVNWEQVISDEDLEDCASNDPNVLGLVAGCGVFHGQLRTVQADWVLVVMTRLGRVAFDVNEL